MKWIVPILIVLIGLYWFTAKDRSSDALIESIASDFRSKGPNPFEVEGFRLVSYDNREYYSGNL